MSCLHHVYGWVDSPLDDVLVRIPMPVRRELMQASTLLLICESDIRLPVSPIISCTDATPDSGGGVRSRISQ